MTAELTIYEKLAEAGIPTLQALIPSRLTVRSSVTALTTQISAPKTLIWFMTSLLTARIQQHFR
jgi:hypothetical protein